jgi:hypothetical protein
MRIDGLKDARLAKRGAQKTRRHYGIAPLAQQCPPDNAYVPHCFDLTTSAHALKRIPELLHTYFLMRNISQHDDV